MKNILKSIILAATLCGTIGATAHAQNLVVNPAFSLGNTGFATDYEFVATNTSTTPTGEYGIVTASNTWNTNFPAFGDHTGGGNMLIANGSTVAGQAFWKQTVSVVPNTTYIFSGFVTAAFAQNPPVLDFLAGTTSLGTVAPSAGVGTFEFFSGTWNSGTNTSIELRLVDNILEAQGNDIAVDDLSLVAVVPEANTAALVALVSVPMLGFLRRRAVK